MAAVPTERLEAHSLCFRGRVPADVAPLILEMLAAGRAALNAPIHDDLLDSADVPAGTCAASEPRDDDVPAGTSRPAFSDLPDSLGARTADALALIAETFLAISPRPRQRAGGDRATINIIVDIETLTTGEDGDCHLANGHHLCAATARRHGCDATTITHLLKDGSRWTSGVRNDC